MAISIDARQLLLLLAWMSPGFPVGAYAYSHGLEWAIEHGGVRSAEDVRAWIDALLRHGSGWNDAVLFAAAWHAPEEEHAGMDELAMAMSVSRERTLETGDLGRSFAIAAGIWRDGAAAVPRAYPVAAAAACKAAGIGCEAGLLAFLQGFSGSLVSVAVRLVPLGQSAGLAIMRDMMPIVAETACRAARSTLDDLGSATILSDIAAMKHETQHSRVFRS